MNKVTPLENFIEFKKTSINSESKIQDFRRYLNKFLNSSKKPLDKFTEQDLIKFLNTLGYKIGTVNDIKLYLKAFIKFTFPDWSMRFRNLEKICKTQTPPKAYTPDQMLNFEEVEKIIQGDNNLLWKNYWRVFFFGGFRPSECAGLKWEQVFFEPEGVIIKLRTGKTKKDFLKSLPKEAEHELKQLKAQSNSEYLFPSVQTGKPVGSRTICARLKKISKRVLGRVVVPYQLRHSIATILYSDDNKKDDDVAQQLGHTKNMRHTYKNMNGEQIKQKARSLWGKPLTPEEKDRIKVLENENKQFRENQENLKQNLEDLKVWLQGLQVVNVSKNKVIVGKNTQ